MRRGDSLVWSDVISSSIISTIFQDEVQEAYSAAASFYGRDVVCDRTLGGLKGGDGGQGSLSCASLSSVVGILYKKEARVHSSSGCIFVLLGDSLRGGGPVEARNTSLL